MELNWRGLTAVAFVGQVVGAVGAAVAAQISADAGPEIALPLARLAS